MPFNNFKEYMSRQDVLAFAVLAMLLLVLLPLSLDIMRLNQVGKYLSFAFVAVGLVLCWGYGGILSLGQGVFYGLGGYALAMFLKLEASSPENTSIQSTPGIPDFMDWNRITELPWFWEPFNSLTFTLIAVIVVPSIFAYLIGVAMFKRRVGGVYFAIISQSIAAIMTILIIGQQGFTGGVNGITDLRTLKGWDINTDFASYVFYFVCVLLLFVCLFVAQFIRKSKTGRILVAMRGQEDRVRFSGYDIANFKIFVFIVGAAFAGIGGAMFTLQEGFMSPSFVGVVPSIEMVIFCAVGGRLSLVGAVYGALLVNVAKTTFGEAFPELWLFAMGLIFIGVVLGLPDGVAGLYNRWVAPQVDRVMDRLLGSEKKPEAISLDPAQQGATS